MLFHASIAIFDTHRDPHGGFRKNGGVPQKMDGLFQGESQSKMDDD